MNKEKIDSIFLFLLGLSFIAMLVSIIICIWIPITFTSNLCLTFLVTTIFLWLPQRNKYKGE